RRQHVELSAGNQPENVETDSGRVQVGSGLIVLEAVHQNARNRRHVLFVRVPGTLCVDGRLEPALPMPVVVGLAGRRHASTVTSRSGPGCPSQVPDTVPAPAGGATEDEGVRITVMRSPAASTTV